MKNVFRLLIVFAFIMFSIPSFALTPIDGELKFCEKHFERNTYQNKAIYLCSKNSIDDEREYL